MNFVFNYTMYKYIDMTPNHTNLNERRVELPLAFGFIDGLPNKNIIEIGNVTRHYRDDYKHDVLDLNEKPNWKIINDDVFTWFPQREYAAAVSISTIEHTDSPLLAFNRILSFAPRVFITFPFGYNGIEQLIESRNDLYFMKRITEDNQWIQVCGDEAKGTQYNKPFPYANAIGVYIR